jgi:hypothetical protein
MTPYEKFLKPSYIKKFNTVLKKIVELKFERKYHQKVKLKLYGIKIKPKNSVYSQVPVEKLLDVQAEVLFFIDTEPSKFVRDNFFEEILLTDGGLLLGLSKKNIWGTDTFAVEFLFNKRPLYELDYVVEDSVNEGQLNEGQYDYQDSEEYYEKLDKILNKFLSTTGKEKNIPNFLGYKALTGKDSYGDFTVKLTGIFKEPFSGEESDTIRTKSRKMIKLLKQMFQFLTEATFYGGSTSTLDNYEQNLNWEKKYLKRKVKDNDDDLPFLQEEKNGIKTRLFEESTDNHELKWHFDKTDRNVKVVKSNGWLLQMDNQLPVELKEGKTFFIPKGVYHRVLKGNGDLIVEIKEIKNSLLEERNKSEYRMEIRKVVTDIINIYKKYDDGEFYLPEELDEEEMVYDFEKIEIPFSVELTINIDESINGVKVNADYWGDDAIELVINYNPKDKEKSMYELVGKLNELIAHEIRHIHQKANETHTLGGPEEKDAYKYYTQPHELDAQLFGFKRLAKLSKKPLLDVVKNWFATNKDVHRLNDEQVEDVINKVLNYK